MQISQLKRIVEAALMVAEQPLTVEQLQALFTTEEALSVADIMQVIDQLKQDYCDKGIELKEVASGYRFQTCADLSAWLSKLYQERPPRYSRALLETLALIAYRQPITRAEIEEVRGVAVGGNIIRTLIEREWIKIIGHRDLPGKPALYATTKQFLDYFGLKNLADLPLLSPIKSLEMLEQNLPLQLNISGMDNATSATLAENLST